MLSSASVPCQVNVTKSSSKLGITIPHFSQSNPARQVVRLTVANEATQASFLALAAPWVTIPTSICTKLNISYDQTISILEIRPVQPHTRPPFKTEGDKVDMLSLIPPTSTNGYQLYVDGYEDNGEPWLRIWYHHPRGAARQIELKRYANAASLGGLLGLLQAEGEKKYARVVFKNSAIAEHAYLVSGLAELGVPLALIRGRCIFNPSRSSLATAYEYAERYRNATRVTIGHFSAIDSMKGAIAADTLVRSSVLAAVLLFSMSEVRRGAFWNNSLRRNFLAKLLTGDGSLDARRRPQRLDVRLTIVDRDIDALQDYAELLSQEGFKASVYSDRITVRAYCTWLNLVRLYEIGAFRNGRNWIKLLCAIKITILGRENRGYKRIQELSRLDSITSDDISGKYGIGRRSANLWIGTMLRKEMLERLLTNRNDGRKEYVVAAKGKALAGIIEAIQRDYDEVSKQKGTDDPHVILQEMKYKGKPGQTKQLLAKPVIRASSAETA